MHFHKIIINNDGEPFRRQEINVTAECTSEPPKSLDGTFIVLKEEDGENQEFLMQVNQKPGVPPITLKFVPNSTTDVKFLSANN